MLLRLKLTKGIATSVFVLLQIIEKKIGKKSDESYT